MTGRIVVARAVAIQGSVGRDAIVWMPAAEIERMIGKLDAME